jgi:hypothetical protein
MIIGLKATAAVLLSLGVLFLMTGAGINELVRETSADRPVAPQLIPAPTLETAADHRDSPNVFTDPAADINDVYAFVTSNGNVALALTVNPFQAPGNPQFFSPEVLYQLKIDNDGDFKEDLVIQFTFDKATADQKFTMVGPVKPKKPGVTDTLIKAKTSKSTVITGPANGTVVTGSNIKVFAGLADDPFFFDFVLVERLIGILPGGPLTRPGGVDFFAGFNVSIIAVELPPEMLKGKKDNNIRVWATTSRSTGTRRSEKFDDKDAPTFVQIDRMGLPAIGTVLIRTGDTPTAKGALKDKFNRGQPSTDVANFTAEVTKQAMALNNDATLSAALAKALLPDVLTLDVTNKSGFLNGRQPADDVIDAELNLLTGGAVKSDGVNANDKAFQSDFPFFATPHTASESVPVRE